MGESLGSGVGESIGKGKGRGVGGVGKGCVGIGVGESEGTRCMIGCVRKNLEKKEQNSTADISTKTALFYAKLSANNAQ